MYWRSMSSRFFYIVPLFVNFMTSNTRLQSKKEISLSLLELNEVLFFIYVKALLCVRIIRYGMIREEWFGKDNEGHGYDVIMDSVLLILERQRKTWRTACSRIEIWNRHLLLTLTDNWSPATHTFINIIPCLRQHYLMKNLSYVFRVLQLQY
jgi:hypothetical protein